MDKEKALAQLAAGRKELEGRDAWAMNDVFFQVWKGELTPDMELAAVLQGRFENTPAWDAALRALYHEIVDEQAYSYRPKASALTDPSGRPVDYEKVARIAARIIMGFMWSGSRQGSGYWADAHNALENWAVDNGFDPYDYYGEVQDNRFKNPEAVNEAATMLTEVFAWDKTEQGYDYWWDVFGNLGEQYRSMTK